MKIPLQLIDQDVNIKVYIQDSLNLAQEKIYIVSQLGIGTSSLDQLLNTYFNFDPSSITSQRELYVYIKSLNNIINKSTDKELQDNIKFKDA